MKKRILSGIRPTGTLHIGNLFGAVVNWIKLQDEYECFYEIADIHALTTIQNTTNIKQQIYELAMDLIACGVAPNKATLFIQSMVPEHSELHLLLSMLVPIPWLFRNPTLKEQIRDLNLQSKINYGLLGYPVLQAADVLLYKAEIVPVGEDQLPHLELAKEIARRFNFIYKKKVFVDPSPMLTITPRVLGINGKRMSKSLNNTILLTDSPNETKDKVLQSFTDPQKIHKNDKGHPEGCAVFSYHTVVNQKIEEIKEDCKNGKIGCVWCKEKAAELLNEYLAPIRERRAKLKCKEIEEILIEGAAKAKKVASKTLNEVKEAMNLW